MQVLHFHGSQQSICDGLPDSLPNDGFIWVSIDRQQLKEGPNALIDQLKIIGCDIHPLHWQDALNPLHPSYFKATETYIMLTIQSLQHFVHPAHNDMVKLPSLLEPNLNTSNDFNTSSITFFAMPKLLISVQDSTQAPLIRYIQEATGSTQTKPQTIYTQRLTLCLPEELLLRSTGIITEQFSALRPTLNHIVDHWQHQLLDPRKRFQNWPQLLHTLSILRLLEDHSEEHYDSAQAFKDYLEDNTDSLERFTEVQITALLTRLNDLKEHVSRTTHHTQRINDSLESTIQLYYSATANRTNEIMRILTVVTAFFLPLNLITGMFGMNFSDMPLIGNPKGFLYIISVMILIVFSLWTWFLTRQYIETKPYRALEKLRLTQLRRYHASKKGD